MTDTADSWWCPHHHRHHHHHHRYCVDVLLAGYDVHGPGGIEVSINSIETSPPTTSVALALGDVHDAAGNVVSDDPIASATFSDADSGTDPIGTLVDNGNMTATFTLNGALGTATGAVAATTQAGVAVTGSWTITESAGAPTEVDVVLTADTTPVTPPAS